MKRYTIFVIMMLFVLAVMPVERAKAKETDTLPLLEDEVDNDEEYDEDVDTLPLLDADDADDDEEEVEAVLLPGDAMEYAEEYDTIIIVDLENQHAYYCEDGEVIADADCVSGDLYDSPTSTGLYEVWLKRKDFYMKKRYYTKYALFFDDSIAIHDADAWRDEYGGSIYKGSGSHGCINVPRWFAKIIYKHCEIGTPVYVF